MKKFFTLLTIACCSFLFSNTAGASSHAGCFFIAKIAEVSKACTANPASKVAKLGGCGLQLKVIAIGKQFGLGQNYCSRNGLLGKTIWAKKIASRLAKKQIPSNRKTYYTASLHSKIGFASLKKDMLLIVRYNYSDGMSPKGVSVHDRWTVLRSYRANEPEPSKKKRPTMVEPPKPVQVVPKR